MAFNGSGTYTLPGAALTTGATVSSTENNTFRNDVATAFNKTSTRDGQTVPTANLPMGGFKHTGLAAGTTAGDSVRFEQFSSPPAIGDVAPNTGKFTALTTTGNTILGDASTDTLNVGNGDLVKDASGNVGIGTSSPSSKLTVNGASGALNFNLANVGGFGTLATFGVLNIGTDNSSYIGSVSNNPFLFYTNNAERARIDSSGNVGIGVTNPSAGASATSGFAFRPGNNDVWFNHANGVGSGTAYTYFAYNSGAIGSITQNGTTGVLYNLTSDYRLKNDQQPLTGAKEFVMALQPKKWQWWDGSGEGVGFVAHEFMKVAKYSGHGEKDAVEIIEIKDEYGNVTGTEERPVYQSIQPSSSEVMANLVSLIQEQQAMITAQSEQISSQAAVITTLTERISALEVK